jgi:iron complex outermembrane receptor protein
MKLNSSVTQAVSALLSSAIAFSFASASSLANAQGADTANAGLEEIVVQARKRSEPLQETPVAVTALTAERIESLHTPDLRGLNFTAPNVEIATISNFNSSVSIFMRGIGNADIDSSIDPPVALFVDGVYLPRPANSALNMFDIEQVEVLRGPQGTLFGRNTTAGAIQFRSKRPTGEFDARAKLVFGEYGRRDLMAAVESPFGSKVAAKIAVFQQQFDGYFTNTYVTPGTAAAANGVVAPVKAGGLDSFAIRPTIAFKPTENFELTLIGEYQKDNDQPQPVINISGPTRVMRTVYGVAPFPVGANTRYVSFNVPGYIKNRIWGLTAEMNWKLGPGQLTFIGNTRQTKSEISADSEGTQAPLFEIYRKEPHKQNSLELRYAGEFAERLSYVVGAYNFRQEYNLQRDTFQNPMNLPAATHVLAFTNQEHTARGAFAQLDYRFTDRLRGTLGGRHTEETKDMNATIFGIFPATGPRYINSKTWSNFDPKVGIDFKWTDDVLAYATWSKGFKSGGYNGRAATLTTFGPYDPEEVKAIELGLKADWLDNRLRTNLAIFHNEYAGLQRTTIRATSVAPFQETITSNAASATVKGAELELTAVPVKGLNLNLAVGYNDAGYDEFCADLDGPGAANTVPTQCAPAVSLGNGTFLVPYDNSGFPLQRAPELSISAGVGYTADLPDNNGALRFRVDYNRTSEMFNGLAGEAVGRRPSTGVGDASITYESPDERYAATFFVKNFTDEIYQNGITLVPPLFDFQTISEPRRWGIEVSWKH